MFVLCGVLLPIYDPSPSYSNIGNDIVETVSSRPLDERSENDTVLNMPVAETEACQHTTQTYCQDANHIQSGIVAVSIKPSASELDHRLQSR